MKIYPEINNELLLWAIIRAGYEPGDFLDKFPNVKEWLNGTKKPTLRQLQEFAGKVYVPFGYLLLDSPPEEILPIPFFRTVASKSDKVSLNVYDTVLLMQKRQEWLTEYLIENESPKLEYVRKFNSQGDIQSIVADIKNTLGLKDNWADELPNWEKAKKHLVGKIEEAGIIVVASSVVGNNNYRKISPEDCRGFVLVNEYAPFMFLNAADSKAAQLFTLAHELAHIWIGESAGFDTVNLMPADHPAERFCDKIAAEFLVPEVRLREVYRQNKDYETLAKFFKVSQIVIARRLLDLGMITKTAFYKFYNAYSDRIFEKQDKSKGGGDFYLTQQNRIGSLFLSYVNSAVRENKLLFRDAYNLTGLRGDTYHNFMSRYLI